MESTEEAELFSIKSKVIQSRIEILNEMATQFGHKDGVTTFEDFVLCYSAEAVTTLVHFAMNKYWLQNIKPAVEKPISVECINYANWISENDYVKRKHTHPNKIGKWLSNNNDKGYLSDEELLKEYEKYLHEKSKSFSLPDENINKVKRLPF